MKRMVRELNVFYTPAMKRELLKMILILYPFLILMVLFMKYTNQQLYSTGFAVLMLTMVPGVMLVGLTMQWLLDIKPLTDRWRKEHALQKRWSHMYSRFVRKE